MVGQSILDTYRVGGGHPRNCFIGFDPLNRDGFVGGCRLSRNRTAPEHEGHDVARNVLIRSRKAFYLNGDARFFEHFPTNTFIEGLPQLQHAAWRFPVLVVAALDH